MIYARMGTNPLLTSYTKRGRGKIQKEITRVLLNDGPKLKPVPYEMISKLKPDKYLIFRVEDLNSKFNKELDRAFKKVQYYASYYGGYYNRARKYAVGTTESGKTYIVYQRSITYGSVYVMIDVAENKSYNLPSVLMVESMILLLDKDLSQVPLLLNKIDLHHPKHLHLKKAMKALLGY